MWHNSFRNTSNTALLTILLLKEHTQGEDIFQAFKNFFGKTQLLVCKLTSITTDCASAMVGRSNGFIAKCRKDDDFPDFLNYRCIIHQQILCAKMLNMKEITDVAATKIACSIRERSLQRRLFRANLKKADCGWGWFNGIKNCNTVSPELIHEILTLQTDIDLKARVHGQFCNLLTGGEALCSYGWFHAFQVVIVR